MRLSEDLALVCVQRVELGSYGPDTEVCCAQWICGRCPDFESEALVCAVCYEEKGMRKKILPQSPFEKEASAKGEWLDLEAAAQVEVTSEDESHPIESALLPGKPGGWRAAGAGAQTIRLLFDEPLNLRRIRLQFEEHDLQRTQEFVLQCSQSSEGPFREIVRQQYNFSPPGGVQELEEYNVELEGVGALELIITPEISGGSAHASLAELRLATI